jgi:hypothetical protein
MTGPVAWFVNGISMNGWSDMMSYNGANAWQNIAFEFNKYDLDFCYGEATSDTAYHREYMN